MAIIDSGFQMVAVSDTPEALTAVSTKVLWVEIEARQSDGTVNVGNVFIGGSDVELTDAPIIPGRVIRREMQSEFGWIDLAEIYVDADNNGDGVLFWYELAQ